MSNPKHPLMFHGTMFSAPVLVTPDDLRVERRAGTDVEMLRASLSSDQVVSNIQLSHDAGAVDLSRFEHGLPILFNHNRDVLIANAFNPVIENGKLYADLIRASGDEAEKRWLQMVRGELHAMSISASFTRDAIKQHMEHVLVTRWTALEASPVTVPDDPSVGIRRALSESSTGDVTAAYFKAAHQQEDPTMDPKDDKTQGGGTGASDFTSVQRQALRDGEARGIEAERARVADIETYFSRELLSDPSAQSLKRDLIAKGTSYDLAKDAAMNWLETRGADSYHVVSRAQKDTDGRGFSAFAGADAADKFFEGACQAVAVRAGVETDETVKRDARGNEFFGLSVLELARTHLQVHNDARRLSKEQLVNAIIKRAMPTHGSSDFPAIFANTANKAAMMGWMQAPQTWRAFSRVGNLTDFKPTDRVGLGGMSDLQDVPASGEFPGLTLSDVKEQIQLGTKGGNFGLNRQAIINDDLNLFASTGRMLGQAAARVPSEIAYGLLLGNPTLLQDATAVFHANHNNIGTGGAVDVATLNALEARMALQTAPAPAADLTGHDLNLEPSVILFPRALIASGRQLANDQVDPSTTSGGHRRNPWQSRFTPVAESRLDRADPDTFYAFADPNVHPTIEIAFLDGVDTPRINEVETGLVDGMVWTVSLDCGGAFLDYRSVQRETIA